MTPPGVLLGVFLVDLPLSFLGFLTPAADFLAVVLVLAIVKEGSEEAYMQRGGQDTKSEKSIGQFLRRRIL